MNIGQKIPHVESFIIESEFREHEKEAYNNWAATIQPCMWYRVKSYKSPFAIYTE